MESQLVTKLAAITTNLRKSLPQQEVAILQTEDLKEEEWLSDSGKREAIAARETLAGRTSGTKEWRSQRSELGGGAKTILPTMRRKNLVLPFLCSSLYW